MFGPTSDTLALSNSVLTITSAESGGQQSVSIAPSASNWAQYPANAYVTCCNGIETNYLKVGETAGGDPGLDVSMTALDAMINTNTSLLLLGAGGNAAFSLAQSGNIGVQKTPDSAVAFDVAGAVRAYTLSASNVTSPALSAITVSTNSITTADAALLVARVSTFSFSTCAAGTLFASNFISTNKLVASDFGNIVGRVSSLNVSSLTTGNATVTNAMTVTNAITAGSVIAGLTTVSYDAINGGRVAVPSLKNLTLATGTVNSVQISGSGNVGIGKAPGVALDVNGQVAAGSITTGDFFASGSFGTTSAANNFYGANCKSHFGTNIAGIGVGRINVQDNASVFIDFRFATAQIGSITATGGGTATAYVTSSDYRLKENVVDFTDGLETIKQIRPVTFNWKSSGEACQGFIAHEFQSVLPNAVHGVKDAVDAEGNPLYQGIDASFLISALTSAVKQLSNQNDALAARVLALEQTGQTGGTTAA
jgi:hypothetical protein